MPSYAHLRAPEVACPACRKALAPPHGLIAFQWGFCPSRQPWDDLFYALGDDVRWRRDDEGRIPVWTYFEGAQQSGNLGDPAFADLSVRALGLEGGDLGCASCDVPTLAIRIESGRLEHLERANVMAEICVISNGDLVPRPDWDDHPMPDLLRVRSRALCTSRGVPISGKLAP